MAGPDGRARRARLIVTALSAVKGPKAEVPRVSDLMHLLAQQQEPLILSEQVLPHPSPSLSPESLMRIRGAKSCPIRMSPPQSLRRPRRLCPSSARASSAESLAAFRSIKSTRRSADGPGAAQNRNQGQISEGASCWRRATPCHAIKSRRETTPRVHPNAAAPLQSGTRHATPSRQNASKASRVPRPGPSLHGPAKLGKTTRLALAPPRHRGPGRPGRSGQHGARQHRPAGPLPGGEGERAPGSPPLSRRVLTSFWIAARNSLLSSPPD